MTARPPSPLAALAAATTPVVAAALLVVAAVAAACGARPPSSAPAASPSGGAAPTSPDPAGSPGAGPATGGRVIVVLGAPDDPRATIRDPAGIAPAMPLALPPDALPLGAIAAAPDGRVAAVATDGRAWIGDLTRDGAGAGSSRAGAASGTNASPAAGRSDVSSDAVAPAWTPLPTRLDPADLPGPVLGAAWSRAADALLLLAGTPGSGSRRMAIVEVPIAGGPARVFAIDLEADGPGVAALEDGQVAFVARDRLDRGALARLSRAGTVATLRVAARSIAAGGDTVVLAADAMALVGSVEDLRHGGLPPWPLPVDAEGGLGAVAVAPDGMAIALVVLDADGAPAAVETLRRRDGAWSAAGTIPVGGSGSASAFVAWIP